MEKKIAYITVASFGSYDSYHQRIYKVFERKEEAEKYVEKFNRVMKGMSDFVGKCWEVVAETEYKTEEEYNNCFHHGIWNKYSGRFEDFNECRIEERELV